MQTTHKKAKKFASYAAIATDSRPLCMFIFLLSLHIHKQPFLARKLLALTKLIERSKSETNPPQILCQVIAGRCIGMAVDAKNEAVAGEVCLFAEFEEGHKTAINVSGRTLYRYEGWKL
jgi:hypothetical protein